MNATRILAGDLENTMDERVIDKSFGQCCATGKQIEAAKSNKT